MKTLMMLLVLSAGLSLPLDSKTALHSAQSTTVPIIVAPSPTTIEEGESTTVTVTVNQAPTVNMVIPITYTAKSLFANAPDNMTVLANQTTGTFTLTARGGRFRKGVPAQSNVTATLNGTAATGTVTVN